MKAPQGESCMGESILGRLAGWVAAAGRGEICPAHSCWQDNEPTRRQLFSVTILARDSQLTC